MIIIYILLFFILVFCFFYLPMRKINEFLKPLAESVSLFEKRIDFKIQDLISDGTLEYYKQLSNKQLIKEFANVKSEIANLLDIKKYVYKNQNKMLVLNCAKAVIIEQVMNEKKITDLCIIKK